MRKKRIKKKVKFSFRRMLAYISTYVACTFGVASVVVLSNSDSYSSNAPILFEEEAPSALGLLVNNLMNLQDMSLNIDLNVKKGDQVLSAKLFGDIVVYSGFSNVDLDLTGELNIDGSVCQGNVVYKDGEVYLTANGETYSFATSSLADSLKVVLALAGVGEMSDVMDGFDMSLITSLGEKITEEVLDNGVKLLFAITDDLSIEILTDDKYNLKSVTLDDYTFGEYVVNANITLPTTNSGLTISTPNESNNITPAFNLLNSAIKTIEKDGINFELNYDNISLGGTFSFGDQAVKLNTQVLGKDASVYYKDGSVYLDAPIIKLKSEVEDIYNAIAPYINIDADVLQKVLGVLSSLNTQDITQNISFEEITESNGHIFLDLNDIQVMFDLNGGLIEKIDLLFDDEIVSVNLNYDSTNVVVPDYEYIDVFDLADLVNPIQNMVNGEGLSTDIEISLGDLRLDAKLNVSYAPTKVQLTGELSGVNYQVTYADQNVYVEFNETKIKVNESAFTEIVEYIKQHTNSDVKVDTKDIKDAVSSLLGMTEYIRLVIDGGYNFTYADNLVALEINDADLLDICLNINNVKAKICVNSTTPEFNELVGDYEEIVITKENIGSLITNLASTDYNLDLEIVAGGETYGANVALSFADGIVVNASTNVFGFDIKLNLQNNNVYVDIDGIKVKGNLTELPTLVETVLATLNTEKNISISEISLPTNLALDLTKINYRDGKLYIDLGSMVKGGKLEISLDGQNVQNIVFTSDDVVAKVTNNKVTEQNKAIVLDESEVSQYQCEVNAFADVLTAVQNSIQNGGAMISSYLYLGENKIYVDARVNWKENVNAYVGLTYGDNTYKIHYMEDVLYLTAYNLKFKFNTNQIDEFVTTLASLMGTELKLDTNELTTLIDNFDIQNITNIVKSIKSGKNYLSVKLDGGLQVVVYTNNNVLSSLHVSSDEFTVINNIRYFNNVVLPKINKDSYVDVTDILNMVNSTKDVLNGKFVLTTTLNVDGQSIALDLNVDNTNGLKVYTDVTIKNKLVSVYYENNALYVAIDEYKLMLEVEDFGDVLAWVQKLFGLDLNGSEEIKFDLDKETIAKVLSYVISNINVSNDNISLTYEEYGIDINYESYVNSIVLSQGENNVSLQITENKELVIPTLPLDEYRDWTVTAGIVEKILSQVNSTMFEFDVMVGFNDSEYSATVKVDLTNNVYEISTTIAGYELVVNFDGETVYVNFGGLKLKDTLSGLMSSAKELLRIFDIKLPVDSEASVEKFGLSDIINTLEIDSFGEGEGYVRINIADVLGLKEKLELDNNLANITLWHGDDSIEKIELNNELFDLSATLVSNKVNIVLSDEEKALYVTNVSELTTYVERLYNSYNNVATTDGYAISGKIAVRYSQLCVQGNLSLNVIGNKIYAHINSSAFGLDTNIYLADKNIYINVAGLKLALTLSENDINNIINWVNVNFNQNISFEYSDEMLDVEMPDLNNVLFRLAPDVFGVSLSEYFMAGSLDTRFEDALINLVFENDVLNTIDLATNVLDKNTVIYESGYGDYAYEFESEESKMKNLVLRLDGLGFGSSAISDIWTFEESVLTKINGEDVDSFNDYSNVLDMVEWVLNYYKEGTYNFDANITLKEKVGNTTRNKLKLENGKIYSTLQVDDKLNPIDGVFYAGGDLIEYRYGVNDDPSTRHSISAYYDNNAFYGSYTHDNKVFNGNANTGKNEKYLRVKIGKDSIREILSIVLHVLAIDLGSVGDTLALPECNLNVENLQNMLGIKKNNSGEIISDIDKILSSVESVIGVIGYINLTTDGDESVFSIGIKQGEKVMNFNIGFEGQKLSYIRAQNIGVSDTEVLDIELGVSESSNVPTYDTTADHIDLTNASSLLKSFINTSSLNDYHISGKVALTVSEIKAAKIDVDVRVKIIDGKPIIAIELSNYPIIGLVNGSNTNGVGAIGGETLERGRKINIYVKDGIAYLQTIDEKWLWYSEYTRITNVSVSTLFGQLEYYMQYLLGFTDTIQGKINEAIEAGKNRKEAINICNIINSFVYENGRYNISLNLTELAYSNDIGTMDITLSTINNASTGNLDYLYQLGVDISMLGIMNLKTDADNGEYLTLVDIGQSLDFTNVLNYINTYYYGLEQEYIKEGSGSYKEDGTSAKGVTFVMNNGSANVVTTGGVGKAITFPRDTYIYDDGAVKREYKLEGWYTDANLTTPFTATTYSRFNDYTVYAKWNMVSEKFYYTYTLNYNNGTAPTTSKLLEGDRISVSALNDYVVDNGVTKVSYYFQGWYLDSAYATPFAYTSMPSENITLYAKWDSVTEYYRTISFANLLGNNVDNITALEYDKITLPTDIPNTSIKNGDTTTLYGFVGWFSDIDCTQAYNTNSMPNGDLTLYAGWEILEEYTEKMLTIIDNGVSKFSGYIRVGSAIVFSNVKVDANTLWYLDQAFTQKYNGGFDSMPNSDLTLYVCNAYTLTINSQYGNVYNNSTRLVYQGSEVVMPSQPSTHVVDTYGVSKITYTFKGYTNATNVMPNSDLTLTANWVETDRKNYYTITFDLLTGSSQYNSSFTGKIKFYKNGVETSQKSYTYLQGDNIDLSEYTAMWEYDTWFFGTIWYHYPFEGWATSDGGSRVYTHPVNRDATLYCRWGDLKTGRA